MNRIAPVALALCLTAAACNPPQGDPADNSGDGVQNMAVNAVDNAAEPPRSILRPDVVEPKAPDIKPVEAVVEFGASPFALDDAARTSIDAQLDTPAFKAGGPITLRGHSDARGNDGDNRAASQARAELVRDYLVEKGVGKDRISVVALGETRPVAPNAKDDGSDNPEGRARNRRVEITIALPPAPPPVVPTLSKQ